MAGRGAHPRGATRKVRDERCAHVDPLHGQCIAARHGEATVCALPHTYAPGNCDSVLKLGAEDVECIGFAGHPGDHKAETLGLSAKRVHHVKVEWWHS